MVVHGEAEGVFEGVGDEGARQKVKKLVSSSRVWTV